MAVMGVPVAVVTWAMVSDDVDRRLGSTTQFPIQLQSAEWTSGSNAWIIDIAGDPQGIGFALAQISNGPLKDAIIKIAQRSSTGDVKIVTLQSLIDAQSIARAGT